MELQYSTTANGNLVGNVVHTGGGTSATLQVRGRASGNLIFVATPNPVILNVSTSAFVTSASFTYNLDIADPTGLRGNFLTITAPPGFRFNVNTSRQLDGILPFRNPPLNQAGLSSITLEFNTARDFIANTISMPITLFAYSSGASILTGTFVHQYSGRETRLPVTANFGSCPNRVDTISVLALYSEQVRDDFAARNVVFRERIRAGREEYERVFTNSNVNNVVVKIINPDGELITNEEFGFTLDESGASGERALVRIQNLAITANSRVYALRQQYKADAVCLFDLSDYNAASLGLLQTGPEFTNPAFIISVRPPTNPVSFSFMRPEAVSYTVLHEIGHICGGDHEPGAPTGSGGSPFAYGQGFKQEVTRILYGEPRTIALGTMMYHGGGSGTGLAERIPFWSNPDVNFTTYEQFTANGTLVPRTFPVGTVNQNMARVMRINGPKMANFFVSTLQPTIASLPARAVVGLPLRFVANVCDAVLPLVYTWSVKTLLGNTVISGTASNGGQIYDIIAPNAPGTLRITLNVRDANGIRTAP
jgi:hypothetical protein